MPIQLLLVGTDLENGRIAGVGDNTLRGNICVYYELSSCKNPQKYMDDMQVSDPTKHAAYCGLFQNGTHEEIAACFCLSDDCNGGGIVRDFMMSTLAAPRPMPNAATWTFIPISDRTTEILKCFQRNMYPRDATPATEADESS
ncbi:hypothetical protein GCK32_018355, partial [Trichostrongylus colubriformis]